MTYKLVASDMDGTLLTHDKRISERNLKAIRKASSMGCLFCLCTGRTFVAVSSYVEQLGLDSPVICANGAVVAMPDGEILYEYGMSDGSTRLLYAYAKELNLTVCIWSGSLLYANRFDRYVEHYTKVTNTTAELFEDAEPIIEKGVLKMIWYADPERMPELHAFLGKKCPDDTGWANSTPRMIEFNDVRTSKATAMAYIGEKYGIKREEMIAIGDNFNDLPMLKFAGLSVAMENAPDEIKAQCSFISDTNNNDGVGKALERFVISPLGTYIEDELSSGKTEISLPEGTFREKLCVEAENISLTGSDTVISYGDYAKKPYEGDELYGTFRSYSAFFRADYLRLENVTVENTAGVGEEVGQAVAAYFDCRKAYIKNCIFKGFQDTIFTAPLPEKPVIPNSFKGPNENLPRTPSLLYFENCRIEGDVDFIFGGACAIFENCEIVSRRGGFVAAPSTPKEQKYGYIFIGCRFTGEGNTYIARPWREHGACIITDCEMGEHISDALWHDWDSADKRENCRFYADIPCTAPFGKALSFEQKAELKAFISRTKAELKG